MISIPAKLYQIIMNLVILDQLYFNKNDFSKDSIKKTVKTSTVSMSRMDFEITALMVRMPHYDKTYV